MYIQIIFVIGLGQSTDSAGKSNIFLAIQDCPVGGVTKA